MAQQCFNARINRAKVSLPAFSANDVRAAIWHFHDCTAMSNRGDCLYPRISYDRMMKLREERREERNAKGKKKSVSVKRQHEGKKKSISVKRQHEGKKKQLLKL